MDSPELVVSIAGAEYQFSELPIAALAELQQYLARIVPHPVRALAGHLDGLADPDRRYLLDLARQEARRWPPQVGTAEGAAALLGTEAGQVEALAAGLSVHHPELTRDDAHRLFRALRKDASRAAQRARREGRTYDGEGTARRIFGVLFGLDDPDDESDRPKG